MSQSDVLTLVGELSNGQADQTLAATFYTDAVNELADRHFLTTASLANFVAYQTELTVPATVRDLIGIIYNDAVIDEMTLRELEHVDYRWRERQGKPRGYTRETETAKTVALYPTPDVTSAAYVSGPQFGTGYPPFNGALLYSGYRDPIPRSARTHCRLLDPSARVFAGERSSEWSVCELRAEHVRLALSVL